LGRIRIVTDSIADIPKEIAQQYEIVVVPANVHFGLRTYRDGIDITTEEFYSKLRSEKELPKTSQPSPGDFADAYRGIVTSGDSIVSIHPSGLLTGTYASACLAREMFPAADIQVMDTRQASMAEGLIAIEAARGALMGLSVHDIVSMVRMLIDRAKLYVSLDSLEFIVRSGRVGRARGFLASVLNIKPIITIANGVVEPLDRVRGAARVIPRLVQMAHEGVTSATVRASVIHAQALVAANQLIEEVNRSFHVRSILASAGPAIVTNAGPGSFGLAVMELPHDHPIPVDN
jgi:DegV family protein with EDD domain